VVGGFLNIHLIKRLNDDFRNSIKPLRLSVNEISLKKVCGKGFL